MEQQETKIAKKDLIRKKTGYPGMEIHKSGEVEYLTLPALRTVKYSDSYGHQQVRRCQYRGLCFFQFQLCAGYEPGGGG